MRDDFNTACAGNYLRRPESHSKKKTKKRKKKEESLKLFIHKKKKIWIKFALFSHINWKKHANYKWVINVINQEQFHRFIPGFLHIFNASSPNYPPARDVSSAAPHPRLVFGCRLALSQNGGIIYIKTEARCGERSRRVWNSFPLPSSYA